MFEIALPLFVILLIVALVLEPLGFIIFVFFILNTFFCPMVSFKTVDRPNQPEQVQIQYIIK